MLNQNSNLRVCPKPTHIEARTVNGHFSWFGTQSFFINDLNKKSANENSIQAARNWASGLSKDFG